jgi:hypothetical protein
VPPQQHGAAEEEEPPDVRRLGLLARALFVLLIALCARKVLVFAGFEVPHLLPIGENSIWWRS